MLVSGIVLFLGRTLSPDTGTGAPADCSHNYQTKMKTSTRGESPLSATPCCASWAKGAPPTEGSSYVVLWDNGSQSVEWSWTAENAQLAVGHLPIPPKPPLDYEPKAYRDFDDRGWVGKYSWHNGEHVHPYQRGRASLTGLMVELQEIIETERLVGVARCGLIGLFICLG
jgi:hypothetical protein